MFQCFSLIIVYLLFIVYCLLFLALFICLFYIDYSIVYFIRFHKICQCLQAKTYKNKSELLIYYTKKHRHNIKKRRNSKELTEIYKKKEAQVASSIRPGSVPKKRKRKGTLIMFLKIKNKKENRKKEKERTYLSVRSGTVRSGFTRSSRLRS